MDADDKRRVLIEVLEELRDLMDEAEKFGPAASIRELISARIDQLYRKI